MLLRSLATLALFLYIHLFPDRKPSAFLQPDVRLLSSDTAGVPVPGTACCILRSPAAAGAVANGALSATIIAWFCENVAKYIQRKNRPTANKDTPAEPDAHDKMLKMIKII
jgi:hypothetical protein